MLSANMLVVFVIGVNKERGGVSRLPIVQDFPKASSGEVWLS